jgi:GNAT superfamily N-acetyltransferase
VSGFAQRTHGPDDVAFIYSSWMKSYRASEPHMASDDYYSLQRLRIDRLIAKHGVLVVYPEGRNRVIAAWACLDLAREAVAHYVYVQREYRGRGIARILLTGRTSLTHWTPAVETLVRHGFRYRPHLLDVAK